jgi:hypothetical protein
MMKSTATRFATNLNQTTLPRLQVLPMGQRLGIEHYKWFPTVVDDSDEKDLIFSNGYWQLNDNIVVIPLYLPTAPLPATPSSHHDPPHPSLWSLLTESFYPMYTLLSMFQMIQKKHHPSQINTSTTVLVQFLPPPQENANTTPVLPNYAWWQTALHTFLSWHTLNDAIVVLLNNTTVLPSSVPLICAKRSVAGMGSLTDHGLQHGHGEHGNEYRTPPQVGRGPQWWEFRNYMIHQVSERRDEPSFGVDDHKATSHTNDDDDKKNHKKKSFQILVSLPSNLPFGIKIMKMLHHQEANHNTATSPENVLVQDRFSVINLKSDFPACSDRTDIDSIHNTTDCIRLATQSHFYITTVEDFDSSSAFGNDAESLFWPALFLPRGATLILYYDDTQKVPIVRGSSRPRMLHFHVWNNLSYLKVHWLPMPRHNHYNKKNKNKQTPESTTTTANDDDDDNLKIVQSLLEMELEQFSMSVEDSKNRHSRSKPLVHGKLNGMNLSLRKSPPPPATIHCVGDNFQPLTSSIYQSCRIQNLCLQLNHHAPATFQVISSPRQQQFALQLSQWNRPDAMISTEAQVYRKRVTIGRVYAFSDESQWFPDIVLSKNTPDSINMTLGDTWQTYYELPPNVVWLPIHPHHQFMHNPGHVLWDLLLPIHTLLSMFDLEEDSLFLTNLDLGMSVNTSRASYKTITKFLPMLGVLPTSFRNLQEMQLEELAGKHSVNNNSSGVLVCASQAAIGMGMLNDHGMKRHGLGLKDYRHLHNVGRGALFYNFRNHILRQMKLRYDDEPFFTSAQMPFQALFAVNSSRDSLRRKDFARQIEHVQSSFSTLEVSVQAIVMSTLPLSQQLQLMLKTSVFVTVIGGAAFTAMFLPQGSCLILYFNDIAGDFVPRAAKEKNRPNMMDFDFWNNASYLRVHWLPLKSMDDPVDLETLRLLIRHEHYILSSNNS